MRTKMIEKIEKIQKNKNLEVTVTCSIRRYAKNPITFLTTEMLIDILNKEYKISKTIEEPLMQVGNSNVKKVRNVGKWVFELEESTKAKKPSTQRATKKTQQRKASGSIRSRMAKIANKKEEED